MLVVLLVCAAPVVASYLTYFVIRPSGRTNYGTLIVPPRELPASLSLTDLRGHAVRAASLKGQWLLIVVSHAACAARCEHDLWLQRQLHESLGREKERVDKVWLIDDAEAGDEAAPRPEVLRGIGAATTVLHAPRDELAAWLQPESGRALEDHVYIVDPRGDWMMRMPPDADPARFKRDVGKLLRGSAGWDQPGR